MKNLITKSNMKYIFLSTLMTLLVACEPTDMSENDEPLLLEGARLVTGNGGVIENGALLVDGGRIIAIGDRGSIESPPNVSVINFGGKTIIPALIDAHAHLGYEGYGSWGATNYSRENLIDNLERYAYYGFSAVFSAGSDPDDLALALQRDQEAGIIDGARFLFAAGMAPPGQGPNNQFLTHALAVEAETGMTILRGIASVEAGRAAVRDVATKGITVVKIWVDDRGGSQEKLQPEVYRAIIDEANSSGIDVYVHQQTAADMPDLLAAGVTGFLHGRIESGMDDALIAEVKRSNAFIVPNLGLGELRRERIGDDSFLAESVPSVVMERLKDTFDARSGVNTDFGETERILQDGFARLINVGVDIILGTDAGAVPDHYFGYAGHRELEIFVRLGMTPMQAIIAATSKPAELLGLSDIGTLAVGKSADFIVLDENPLDDIRNTQTISKVYLRGAEIDRTALRQEWGSSN
jgi:imidazolonepropionase-like amidohydrolase